MVDVPRVFWHLLVQHGDKWERTGMDWSADALAAFASTSFPGKPFKVIPALGQPTKPAPVTEYTVRLEYHVTGYRTVETKVHAADERAAAQLAMDAVRAGRLVLVDADTGGETPYCDCEVSGGTGSISWRDETGEYGL